VTFSWLTRQQRGELSLKLLDLDSSEAESDDLAVRQLSAATGFALLDESEAKEWVVKLGNSSIFPEWK
jgi:hypothetical protein